MKFMHCADLHLGGANAQERMQAFLRLLDVCRAQQIPLLLIAGDLFDGELTDPAVRRAAFAAMQAHPELSVLIAAGNHDPLTPGGNYDLPLPENVYVFGPEWSCVRIAELRVRVWGASFAGRIAPPFDGQGRRREEGFYELGVLHGDLVSPNAASDYRAVTQASIAAAGLDYLALGHVHKRSEPARAGRTTYAYAGCLQGAGFDEPGEKGAYVGEIDENGLRLEFVRLCGSLWLEAELDVTGESDLVRMAQRAQEAIGRTQNHVRLILTGQVDAPVDAAALARLLKGTAASLRVEDRTTAVDHAALARENTLRGAFVRRMLQRIGAKEAAGEAAEVEKLALRSGLAAFEGEVRWSADRADHD